MSFGKETLSSIYRNTLLYWRIAVTLVSESEPFAKVSQTVNSGLTQKRLNGVQVFFLFFFLTHAVEFCFVFFFNLFYLFIILFLAVLGLRFCARAFSSCGERGPLFIAMRGPLTIAAYLVAEHNSRRAGSVVVAHGPSCSTAYGIVPDQGSNPCPLHWQADSQPLRHQGSPLKFSWLRNILPFTPYNIFCVPQCVRARGRLWRHSFVWVSKADANPVLGWGCCASTPPADFCLPCPA